MAHWIQDAIKEPGAFSASAKRAGMSTQAYAQKKKNAPGKTGKRARLALTLGKLGKKRKKKAKKSKPGAVAGMLSNRFGKARY